MKWKTKRRMRIIWCLIVPMVLLGLVYYIYVSSTDDVSPIKTALIALGVCVALNLPMFIMAIVEDACDSRIATFFTMFLLAPIWLIWNWFSTVISLLKGKAGTDWIGGKSDGGRKSNGGGKSVSQTKDDRSDDNYLLFNAMERAISGVRSNSSNYSNGSYVRVAGKDVKYLVTRLFGIKIYGTVTYEITNYNMSQYDYEQDINNALEETTNKLIAAAEEAAENVQEKYKGYDCEWKIEVELNGKVKG